MKKQPVSPKRKYVLRKRAEKQAETRRRIVEATVMFHQTVGPSRTREVDICRKAGVQRATFYRIFPDALSLFKERRAFAAAEVPPPGPNACVPVPDPMRRVRAGVEPAYAGYGQ